MKTPMLVLVGVLLQSMQSQEIKTLTLPAFPPLRIVVPKAPTLPKLSFTASPLLLKYDATPTAVPAVITNMPFVIPKKRFCYELWEQGMLGKKDTTPLPVWTPKEFMPKLYLVHNYPQAESEWESDVWGRIWLLLPNTELVAPLGRWDYPDVRHTRLTVGFLLRRKF